MEDRRTSARTLWRRGAPAGLCRVLFIVSCYFAAFLLLSCEARNNGLFRELSPEANKIITDYVNSTPQYNTYLLVSQSLLYNSPIKGPGFLIGPFFPLLNDYYEGCHALKLTDIGNNRVYALDDMSVLVGEEKDEWTNINKLDKSVMLDGVLSQKIYPSDKNSNMINYLCRARLFYYANGSFLINNRPDTVYLPRVKMDGSPF